MTPSTVVYSVQYFEDLNQTAVKCCYYLILIFILFNKEATTQDLGRSKILGVFTERRNMDMKHFPEPFNRIIQIWFVTLFYFLKWISCHQGACQEKFISGICCRTLASILVINKTTNVIMPAQRHSRRWTLMRGCHGKHYRGTSLLVEVEYLYMANSTIA